MKPFWNIPLLLCLEHDLTPEAKQQRQSKYREELQAQIKEREMQKKRYGPNPNSNPNSNPNPDPNPNPPSEVCFQATTVKIWVQKWTESGRIVKV